MFYNSQTYNKELDDKELFLLESWVQVPSSLKLECFFYKDGCFGSKRRSPRSFTIFVSINLFYCKLLKIFKSNCLTSIILKHSSYRGLRTWAQDRDKKDGGPGTLIKIMQYLEHWSKSCSTWNTDQKVHDMEHWSQRCWTWNTFQNYLGHEHWSKRCRTWNTDKKKKGHGTLIKKMQDMEQWST